MLGYLLVICLFCEKGFMLPTGGTDGDEGTEPKNWDHMKPLESGNHFQGDILLPPTTRSGYRSKAYRWPRGRIPYVVEGGFSYEESELIRKAILTIHNYTCIRFARRERSDRDYVAITNFGGGCYSYVGRVRRGRQTVNLESPGCTMHLVVPLHELMHTIGFQHEHTRPDRDYYVTIHPENAALGKRIWFVKDNPWVVYDFGVPYDYKSVMHYPSHAFSVNGKPTIVPKDKDAAALIGNMNFLSKGDIQKINRMYNCPNKN